MARRSMFVALTKGFTSPPVPNGPASAFEGTGGSLAGAFLHKQFMQGRPSWRHAITAGTREARASPRCGERVPLFNFDFQKRGRTPTSKRALKPAVLFDVGEQSARPAG
jgi:hypothetical protein